MRAVTTCGRTPFPYCRRPLTIRVAKCASFSALLLLRHWQTCCVEINKILFLCKHKNKILSIPTHQVIPMSFERSAVHLNVSGCSLPFKSPRQLMRSHLFYCYRPQNHYFVKFFIFLKLGNLHFYVNIKVKVSQF